MLDHIFVRSKYFDFILFSLTLKRGVCLQHLHGVQLMSYKERHESNFEVRESTAVLGQSLQSDCHYGPDDSKYQYHRNTRVVTSRILETEYSTYAFEQQGYCSRNTDGLNSDSTWSSDHHGQSASSYFRKG